MMSEIITLIIHEANTKEGEEMGYKLRDVLTEINLRIGTMVSDLFKIKEMESTDQRKEEMRQIVLSSYKG